MPRRFARPEDRAVTRGLSDVAPLERTMGLDRQPHPSELAWPNAEASTFVSSGGLRWHMQRVGSGVPALLIHGTGASSHSWEGLAGELKRDFALTIVDLPGHGFTQAVPRTRMSLDVIARDLGSLLGTVGCTPDLIVGHSAGAAIAVRMVIDACLPPPRLVVSVNGAILPWAGIAGVVFPPLARLMASAGFAASLLARRAEQPGQVERMIVGTGGRPPERSIGFYRKLMERPSHVQAALDMMAMWDLDALARDLTRFSPQLEMIACGEDRAVPAEVSFEVCGRVRGASVTYLRKLGHLAHEEDPGAVAAVVRAAYGRVLSSAGDRASAEQPTGRHT